jgi:hypothetical protein
MRALWIACGVVGVILLIPFSSEAVLAAGAGLMIVFVALGVFIVASPEFLERDAATAEDRVEDGP